MDNITRVLQFIDNIKASHTELKNYHKSKRLPNCNELWGLENHKNVSFLMDFQKEGHANRFIPIYWHY